VRVVFDSNIFVSAFMFPNGRAEAAISAVANGDAELFVSKPIIHEVLNVLSRKFDRDAEQLARASVFLSELATVVQPRGHISVLKDEPDNRILECAVAAHAGVVVTGDQAMLDLGEYKGIHIVTLRAFLDTLT